MILGYVNRHQMTPEHSGITRGARERYQEVLRDIRQRRRQGRSSGNCGMLQNTEDIRNARGYQKILGYIMQY